MSVLGEDEKRQLLLFVMRYARHQMKCEILHPGIRFEANTNKVRVPACTCGFDADLAELRKALGEPE